MNRARGARAVPRRARRDKAVRVRLPHSPSPRPPYHAPTRAAALGRYDPVFSSSSSIYNGKIVPQTRYAAHERIVSGSGGAFADDRTPAGLLGTPLGCRALPRHAARRAPATGTGGLALTGVVRHGGSFFPHEYPHENSTAWDSRKGAALVHNYWEHKFNLYFDTRLTGKQAARMLTYIDEGGYIDAQTRQIEVGFQTRNPLRHVCLIGVMKHVRLHLR